MGGWPAKSRAARMTGAVEIPCETKTDHARPRRHRTWSRTIERAMAIPGPMPSVSSLRDRSSRERLQGPLEFGLHHARVLTCVIIIWNKNGFLF